MKDLFDFQPQWEQLVERVMARGYAALSADEKVWLNVQYLTNSISNGGLISYYYNSPADSIADCMQALDLIGATRMKALLEQTNRLFPGGVPTDLTARNEIINAWPDNDDAFDQARGRVEDAAVAETTEVEARLVEFIERTGLDGGPARHLH